MIEKFIRFNRFYISIVQYYYIFYHEFRYQKTTFIDLFFLQNSRLFELFFYVLLYFFHFIDKSVNELYLPFYFLNYKIILKRK